MAPRRRREPQAELAERLTSEATEAFGTKKAFQQAMAAARAPGHSWPTVLGYLNGAVEPPVAFLAAAAEVMDLRLEYLVTGNGPRTEGGWREWAASYLPGEHTTPLWQISAGPDEGDQDADEFAKRMRREFSELDQVTPIVRILLGNVYARWVNALGTSGSLNPNERFNRLLDLRRFVFEPLEAFGNQMDLRTREANDYLIGMLHSLSLGMPKRIEHLEG